MVRPGQMAPDFTGEASVRGNSRVLSLPEFRGKWPVLLFYPLDFTFICPTELRAFGRSREEFLGRDADVIAIRVDSVDSHQAWCERDLPDVRYLVLADSITQIACDYGVLDAATGIALRGTFIIDPDGFVQDQVVSARNVGRSTDETLRVLEALQTGQLCPVNWRPGQRTLGQAA